jgi:hypothetical protein
MRIVTFFIAGLITFIQSCSTEKDTQKDEEVLRHLKEVEWPKAYREQDTALLDRILADEFKMIRSDGVRSTKKKELEYIKTHKPSYESFRFNIDRLEIFENNTAIVSGIGIINYTDSAGPYEIHYSSSNVLIKRNGMWKAISSHTSGDSVIRK